MLHRPEDSGTPTVN